jgi:hypothetical protein
MIFSFQCLGVGNDTSPSWRYLLDGARLGTEGIFCFSSAYADYGVSPATLRSTGCEQPDIVRLIDGSVVRLKDMAEQFDTKAAEIRAMFSNPFEPKRTAEICERMPAACLPI